tara:strand:- start:193 stop:1416 length:1224 start_codon:yes stop_codon:yes gene_type:complete
MAGKKKDSQKGSNKIPGNKKERPLRVPRERGNTEPNSFKFKKELFDKTGNMWIPDDETRKRYFDAIYGRYDPRDRAYLLRGHPLGRWHISYERLTRRPHISIELPDRDYNWHPDFEPNHPVGRLLARFARDRHRITNVYREENRQRIADRDQRLAELRAERLGGRRRAATRGNAAREQQARENESNRRGRMINNFESENQRKERLQAINRLLANKEFKEFLERERVRVNRRTPPRKSNLGIKKQAQSQLKKNENKKKYKETIGEWVRKIKPSTSKSAPKGRASRRADKKKTKRSKSPVVAKPPSRSPRRLPPLIGPSRRYSNMKNKSPSRKSTSRRSSRSSSRSRSVNKKMSEKKRGKQKMSVKSMSKKQVKSASPRTQNAIAKLLNNNMKVLKVGSSKRSPSPFKK